MVVRIFPLGVFAKPTDHIIGGHYGVGGDPEGDFITSPGDPIFIFTMPK
jgi:hypothetical protein